MSIRSISIRQATVMTVLVLAAGACAPASGPTTAPPTDAPASAPASATPSAEPSPSVAAAPGLLLEVTTEGGFINPAASLGSPPALVVDTDGRIYTPGVPTGDATLVTPVLVRDVGAAGEAAIVEAMRAAGLDTEQSGGGVSADTGTTVFTAGFDGDLVVSRFVPTGGPGRPGQPAASDAPGAAAFDLLAKLADPTVAWGGSTGTETPYAPVGFRVWAAPSAGGATDGATGSQAATPTWPLVTPLLAFGQPAAADFGLAGLRTGVVTGNDAVALQPLLAEPAGTAVDSAGTAWTIWIRALYPDELGS